MPSVYRRKWWLGLLIILLGTQEPDLFIFWACQAVFSCRGEGLWVSGPRQEWLQVVCDNAQQGPTWLTCSLCICTVVCLWDHSGDGHFILHLHRNHFACDRTLAALLQKGQERKWLMFSDHQLLKGRDSIFLATNKSRFGGTSSLYCLGSLFKKITSKIGCRTLKGSRVKWGAWGLLASQQTHPLPCSTFCGAHVRVESLHSC